MKYAELELAKRRSSKRVGRGISAGQGKTAGRGTKGQNSRAGSSRKPGFEGGSNPLMQRLPKLRGFNSHRTRQTIVYTGQVNSLKEKIIDNHSLAKSGLIDNPYTIVKLLNKGEITKPLVIKLQVASKSAIDILVAGGGSFIPTPQLPRSKKTEKSS